MCKESGIVEIISEMLCALAESLTCYMFTTVRLRCKTELDVLFLDAFHHNPCYVL
jgi:hypothetical protein